MRFTSGIVVAFVAAASAATPPGLLPESSGDLTVAFGDTLATEGVNLPREVTLSAPSLGTAEKLEGTYTLMMVDYDIPSSPPSKRLHWMQPGLISDGTATTIAGKTVFKLTNTSAAFAEYNPPTPPNRPPVTHRYAEMLLNTTGIANADSVIASFSGNRTNFDPVAVVDAAGVSVVAGNWFNVTNANATAASGGNATVTTSGPVQVTETGAASLLTKSGGSLVAAIGIALYML